MSVGSDDSCVLLSRGDSRNSCFDEVPGDNEDSVLEMLSFSKFSDLETWLCMPSSLLLPGPPDSSHTSSSSLSSHASRPASSSSSSSCSLASDSRCSICSEPADIDTPLRSSDFLDPGLLKEMPFLTTPLAPLLFSTPTSAAVVAPNSGMSAGESSSQGRVSIRKRRRLAASPGGLHWNSAGSVQRDFLSPDRSQVSGRSAGGAQGGGSTWARERTVLRKTVSVDEQLLQVTGDEQTHLERKERRNNQSLGTSPRYESRKTTALVGEQVSSSFRVSWSSAVGNSRRRYPGRSSRSVAAEYLLPSGDNPGVLRGVGIRSTPGSLHLHPSYKVCRLAQKWNQRSGPDDLIKDLKPLLLYTGTPQSSISLDRHLSSPRSQQMQNLQLTQNRKCPAGPASPNAAKRLYRNLSEKLRGNASSFEDTYFFGKIDRLRKTSTMRGSEVLLEAVEQQDLDTVQILLYQFSAEDLDLSTPDSQGLTPLDIAIMTNNTPIAKLLLKAGAKESPHFVSVESREAHLNMLVLEAERRVTDLAVQAQRDGRSLEAGQKDKQLRTWEWRTNLYKRMKMGFQHARVPEAPGVVRLSISSSTTLTVSFQEPQCFNSTVVTKYKVEWSCLQDFSLLAGELMLDHLQTLKCIISGLTTGRLYYVRVSAYNMKGWGPPVCSCPPSAAPSNWREGSSWESRRRGQIEAMERLLQQVRATHTHYCCGDASKLQNPSRKQSVSRSLKHLFNSSSKFVKTLKRGVYLAAILYHQDSLLVTAEDQIPIVEVDDAYSSSLTHDFLWFTKLSCMWEDVRWLRQSTSVSTSSSSTLQARHKMLTAAAQLQSMLGTHNLGRVHYEPIKDRHGNVLLVTIRDTDGQHSLFSGKWMQVSKLQSQRKSLSTPEEPYALDILIITIQDLVAYQRRSTQQLAPGLYLGYLKLSSSVDQIRVLVSQWTPNALCHSRIRDNANVSREEWDWIQSLSAEREQEDDRGAGLHLRGHTPLLYYELQTAIRTLLKHLNVDLDQARHFRLYTQEVVEFGHSVSFLLLLPAADSVCSAPGQSNPYTPMLGFLHLPLQMFELVHFCTYKQKLISLFCRLSSVLDLDALITQQTLREAITDHEVATAKQRHQLILDYIQQLDEMRRDLRWITDALQFARYKHPHGGVNITCLVDINAPDFDSGQQKTDSTSSAMDFLTTPSPSPKLPRMKTISDSLLGSDEDGSSEVFLPTDSDYDSCDALSPHESDLLYSPPQDLSQQAMFSLGGSAPDVLHELRYPGCPFKDLLLDPVMKDPKPKDSPLSSSLLPHTNSLSKEFPLSPFVPSTPLSHRLSEESVSLTPALSDTTKTLECLSLSKDQQGGVAPLQALANPPAKRKLLSRSRQGQYFSGPQRWLRGNTGESHGGSLSEGIYTKQVDPDLSLFSDLPSPQGTTYVSHASCILESRKGCHRELHPHVRRIFVESRKEPVLSYNRTDWEEVKTTSVSVVIAQMESGGEEPQGASNQEVDSDDQTNTQMSEILSSTL